MQASKKEWGTKINTPEELIEMIGSQFSTEARYRKAVQHVAESESGLSNTKKDLGPLVKELDKDLLKEYREDISAALMSYFFPKIAARAREGFNEWYEQEISQSVKTNESKEEI